MQPLSHRLILLPLLAIASFVNITVAQAPKPAALPVEKTYTLAFDKSPWPEVFKWFEKESGLTYIDTDKDKLKGTLTLKSDRKYTLPQVLDLLNEALASQKLIILRRLQTFLVHPSDERLPPELVSMILPEDLSLRGDAEIVQVILPLMNVVFFEDIQPSVKKLLSKWGTVSEFGAKHIIVLDKAKNIRNIMSYLGVEIEIIGKVFWKTYSVPPGTAEAAAKTIRALPEFKNSGVQMFSAGASE